MAQGKVSLEKKPASLKNVFEREQVEDNLRYAMAASIAGMFNATVALIAFWSAAYAPALIGWYLAVALGATLRAFNLRSHKRMVAEAGETNDAKLPRDAISKQRRMIEFIAFYNGACWGLGAVLMAFIASPMQYVLLIILCSGMMGASVTTYTSMARAAVLFITPLTIGSLMVLVIGTNAPTVMGSVLLGCYFLLLVKASFARQERFLARVKAREELRETSETVKLLLNDFEAQASDWLWEVDASGKIAEPSARFAEAAGRAHEVLEGSNIADLFEVSSERSTLIDHIESQYGFRNLTLRLDLGGDARWWTLSAQPSASGGMRGVASDVSAQKVAEERVSYMAHYDGLTGLANRFQFNEALGFELSRRNETGGAAILYLDLDSFKGVNDTLGHPMGDKLLCEMAQRIARVCEEEHMVARFGGDEFAVLLSGMGAAARAEGVAKKILASVAEPVKIDNSQMVVTTTIGISTSGADVQTAADLIQRADLALYAAKETGKNCYMFFEPGMDHAAQERRQIEMDMREAIRNGEFELHYQPQVKIETGKTVAYEALIRWNHPTRGVVMPDEFVPIAEDTGLIVPIGEWVLREACNAAAQWPEDLRVSVNLSPIQMRSSNLVTAIFGALAVSGLDPRRLELEITENVLLHDSETNMATLHKLHDFGIRIALDDFGTGYSSLNYLRSFPFDKIKIDKCFINDIGDSSDSLAIVKAVTGLAQSMGIETTAEGVELQDQLERLKFEGCTEAQGYLFSRPQNPEQFSDMRSGNGVQQVPPPAERASVSKIEESTAKSGGSDDAELRGPDLSKKAG